MKLWIWIAKHVLQAITTCQTAISIVHWQTRIWQAICHLCISLQNTRLKPFAFY